MANLLQDLRAALVFDEQGRLPQAAAIYKKSVKVLLEMVAAEHDLKTRLLLAKQVECIQTRLNEIEMRVQELEYERTRYLMPTTPAATPQRRYDIWSGIFGLRDAVEFFREQLVLPSRFPEMYKKKQRLWNAAVLHGPSGCGKTHLLTTFHTELSSLCPNIKISYHNCSELVSNAVDGDVVVRNAFEDAVRRQEQNQSTIILLENIDLLNPNDEGFPETKAVLLRNGKKYRANRENATSVRAEVLQGLRHTKNGHFHGLSVVGTTNRPWSMDAGLRRRFDKRIVCPPLDIDECKALLSRLLEQGRLRQAVEEEILDRSAGQSTERIVQAISRALKQPLIDVQTKLLSKLDTGMFAVYEGQEFLNLAEPHETAYLRSVPIHLVKVLEPGVQHIFNSFADLPPPDATKRVMESYNHAFPC